MKLYKIENALNRAMDAVIELQSELSESARYCPDLEDQRSLAKRCRELSDLEDQLREALHQIETERQANAAKHGREIKTIREKRIAKLVEARNV
jgi:hypothetical protein